MAEFAINGEMFFGAERETSAVELNFIKNPQGVYYNSLEGAVHIIDSLADSLIEGLGVVLFITRDSIVMAFANNPETLKATAIEFNLNKDTRAKDLNRLRLALHRYCLIYSTENNFHIVQLARENRAVRQMLDKTGIKYETIDEPHVNHTISKLLKSFSVAQKVKRVAISIGIASLSLLMGAYINFEINLHFKAVDLKMKQNDTLIRKYKKSVQVADVRYEQLKEQLDSLVFKEYQPNPNILLDFANDFNGGNLYIKNFKVVSSKKRGN